MTGGNRGTGAAIEAADGRALVIRADRNNPDAAVAAVAATVRTLGGLDILVNNAGIFAADVRAVFLRTTPPPPSRAAGGAGSRVGSGMPARSPPEGGRPVGDRRRGAGIPGGAGQLVTRNVASPRPVASVIGSSRNS
ncbi:SDR family NAD(P)-dependent oxidoreductase [Streptomyces pseudovenezuelae]|uniref:SDR family NAD(P)-dependent oxidoreductase n=1 Tax=Streptomyces pseudovenezuelae TaxID=67350 RepID=UPI0036DFD706